MMRTQNWLAAAGIGAALCLSASNGLAQNGGGGGGGGGGGRQRNMDPAQRQQMMMERFKELLEVNNDDEWNAMQPMIQKVMEARRETFPGGRGMFGGRRGGQGGGGGGGGDQGGGGGNAMRRGPGGEPSPEVEALQRAVEAKASKGEIKAALARYVESRKVKAEQLKTAQENLRKVLTARQEAIATLNGLL